MDFLRSSGLPEERIFFQWILFVWDFYACAWFYRGFIKQTLFISLVFAIFAKLNYLCKIKRKIKKKQIYEEEISCI